MHLVGFAKSLYPFNLPNKNIKHFFFYLCRKFPLVPLQTIPVTFSVVHNGSDFQHCWLVFPILEFHIIKLYSLYLFYVIFKKFIQVVGCIVGPFFLIAEFYFFVWIYHNCWNNSHLLLAIWIVSGLGLLWILSCTFLCTLFCGHGFISHG